MYAVTRTTTDEPLAVFPTRREAEEHARTLRLEGWDVGVRYQNT
jgi:hypothetical protein